MCCILVVDDEIMIRKVIREYCEYEGYRVMEAGDGREAVQICRDHEINLVILDVMLPKMDGFTACREIRRQKDIPVIMLSARGEEYDKLFGFELGIDDYIVKPFSPVELMARIRVVLRRQNSQKKLEVDDQVFSYQGLQVNMERRSVSIDGKEIMLALKDYELLLYLIKNRNKALSREKLFIDVWKCEFIPSDRTIDTHIKILRNALGPYRELIVTLRGMGYRFEVSEE